MAERAIEEFYPKGGETPLALAPLPRLMRWTAKWVYGCSPGCTRLGYALHYFTASAYLQPQTLIIGGRRSTSFRRSRLVPAGGTSRQLAERPETRQPARSASWRVWGLRFCLSSLFPVLAFACFWDEHASASAHPKPQTLVALGPPALALPSTASSADGSLPSSAGSVHRLSCAFGLGLWCFGSTCLHFFLSFGLPISGHGEWLLCAPHVVVIVLIFARLWGVHSWGTPKP